MREILTKKQLPCSQNRISRYKACLQTTLIISSLQAYFLCYACYFEKCAYMRDKKNFNM